MKITRKILENIIKEELELVILEQKLKEVAPLVAASAAAKAIGAGIAGEVVFSRLVDALGLSSDDSKYLEDLFDKSEERVILHVMGELEGSEEKLNKKIKTLTNEIEFLKAFVEPPK